MRVAWTDPCGRVIIGRIAVTGGRARLIDDTGRIVNRR